MRSGGIKAQFVVSYDQDTQKLSQLQLPWLSIRPVTCSERARVLGSSRGSPRHDPATSGSAPRLWTGPENWDVSDGADDDEEDEDEASFMEIETAIQFEALPENTERQPAGTCRVWRGAVCDNGSVSSMAPEDLVDTSGLDKGRIIGSGCGMPSRNLHHGVLCGMRLVCFSDTENCMRESSAGNEEDERPYRPCVSQSTDWMRMREAFLGAQCGTPRVSARGYQGTEASSSSMLSQKRRRNSLDK